MFLVLTLLLAATTPIDAKSLIGNAMSPSPDLASEIAKVKAARESAPQAERPIYNRLIGTLEKVNAGAYEPAAIIGNVASMCRDLSELYPHDVTLQRQVAATFVTIPMLADNMGVDGTPYRAEGLTRAKKLITDYPKDARAWEIYASAIEDEREIIFALKKCHQLDARETHCRERHAAMLATMARPQCLTKDVTPTLVARGAVDAIPGITTGATIVWQGSTFALEPAPVFVAADVAVVSRDPSTENVIDLTLTPEGAKKLEVASMRLLEMRGRMALLLGAEPIFVAHVVSPLSNGRVRLSSGAEPSEALHIKLCRKVQTPKIPAELQLQ